jgi:hypothetical protein
MLERVLSTTFKNLSTLFLVAFVVLLPLHLAHSFVFRNVIEVRELHDEIEKFPPLRQVRGVGTQQLDRARISFWILSLLEVAALPLGARAARTVIDDNRRSGVATVPSALAGIGSRIEGTGWGHGAAGAVIGAIVIGGASGWMLESAGSTLVQMLPDRAEFAWLALVQASARALGAAFVMTALAIARSRKRALDEPLELY